MNAFPTLGWSLLAIGVVMVGLWLVSLPLRNASIVDIAWGPLFAVQAIVYFAVTPDGFIGRKVLVTALVAIWAARLASHIAARNLGHGEDYRYVAWRKAAGDSWWWRSFFRVFATQGLLAWVIGMPLLAAQIAGPDSWTLLDAAGAVAWGIGFTFEALGDWQLARFVADPANRGRLVEHLRPGDHDLPARQGVRRGAPRAFDRPAPTRLRRLHGHHLRLPAVVPATAARRLTAIWRDAQ